MMNCCINCAAVLSIVEGGRRLRDNTEKEEEEEENGSYGIKEKYKDKEDEVPAALAYLFNLELHLHPTSFHEVLSLCTTCGHLLCTLYQLHKQFEQLTAINSFLGILLKTGQKEDVQVQQEQPPTSSSSTFNEQGTDSNPPPSITQQASDTKLEIEAQVQIKDEVGTDYEECLMEVEEPPDYDILEEEKSNKYLLPKNHKLKQAEKQLRKRKSSRLDFARRRHRHIRLLGQTKTPAATTSQEKQDKFAKYTCSVCDKVYHKRLSTELHLVTHYHHHQECQGLGGEGEGKVGSVDESEFTPFVSYTCFWCWKVFGIKDDYMKHIQAAHLMMEEDSNYKDLQDQPTRSNKILAADIENSAARRHPVCEACSQGRIIILNGYNNKEPYSTSAAATAALGQQIQLPCKLHRYNTCSLKCQICGQPSGTAETHLIHSKLTHIPKSGLLEAIEAFHAAFTCLACGAQFAFGASLLQHAAVVHSSTNSGVQAQCACNLCGAILAINKSSIPSHIDLHTRLNFKSIIPPLKANHVEQQEQEKDCKGCQIKILGSTAAEDEDEEPKPIYFGQQLLQLCPSHVKQRFGNLPPSKHHLSCPICGYPSCSDKRVLKNHLLKHYPGEERYVEAEARKKFLCAECGLSFVLEATLAKHTCSAAVHHDQKFSCSNCPTTFQSALHLKQHNNYHCPILSDLRPFECPTCHARYRNATRLKRHIIKHNFSFKCHLCVNPKIMKNGACLKAHYVKVHHFSETEARGTTYPNAIPIGQSERAKAKNKKKQSS